MFNINNKPGALNKVSAWTLLSLYISTGLVSPVMAAVDNYGSAQLVPYSVVAGDTLYNISQRHGISLDQLIALNQRSPSSLKSDSDVITVGQVLYVPAKSHVSLPDLGSTSVMKSAGQDQDIEGLLASQANRLGQTYGQRANNTEASLTNTSSFGEQEKAYLKGVAKSAFEAEANQRVKGLLGGFGTVETELRFDDNMRLKSYSADLLAPLVDTPERLLFLQAGGRQDDSTDRTIVNLGVGQRHFFEEWMLGYNAFFDWDVLRHHSRLGLGGEAWADNLKLAANVYTPLSDWKDSHDFDEYLERAARGLDINAKYYFPSYPQLGVSAKFEHYFGNEVDLLGNKSLTRNPYAGTAGLEWQPVPLLKVGVDHRQAKGGQSDTHANIGLQWRIGASLDDMLSAKNVELSRQLQGMRHDLVERNNNIVLEYKEKERTVAVEHASIVGMSGDVFSLSPVLSMSKGHIVSWNWSSLDPLLQGSLSDANIQSPTLTLPVLPPDVITDKEFFMVITITDERGRTYQSAPISVIVRVNPELLAKRLIVTSEGHEADSIDSPTAEAMIADQGTIIEFQLARELKADASSRAVVEAKEVIFEKELEGYHVEQLEGGFKGRAGNDDAVWVNKLKVIPRNPGQQLMPEVLSFHAKGAAGQASGSVHITLKNNATIDPTASPLVNDLRMLGQLEVGQELTASYRFDANGGDANDKSTFAWGNKGNTAAIVGTSDSVTTSGQVPAITLTKSDAGEVKEVSVQAKNGLGLIGNTLTVDSSMSEGDGNETTGGGEGGAVIDQSATPLIQALRMEGKLQVGHELTASYRFDANGGDVNDKSTFAWGNKGNTAAEVSTGASVSASGQVPGMILTKADAGEVKEVSVQAKNGLGLIGNTLTVDSSMSEGDGNETNGGGEGGIVIDPTNYQVEVRFNSSATVALNGIAGERPVAQKDVLTAYCQMEGEPVFTPCEGRYTLRWFVGGASEANVVAGVTSGTFTPRAQDQGKAVQVEVTPN